MKGKNPQQNILDKPFFHSCSVIDRLAGMRYSVTGSAAPVVHTKSQDGFIPKEVLVGMKAKAFWVMLCLLVVAGSAMVWIVAQRSTFAGEFTEQQAIAAAERFLQTCQLPPASGTPRARLRTGQDGWQFWEIVWPGQYTLYFGDEAVWIDAADGSVLGGRLLK